MDFLIKSEDVVRAKEELERSGLQVEQPPEDWLFKVRSDGLTVDVLHRGSGRPLAETVLFLLERLGIIKPA